MSNLLKLGQNLEGTDWAVGDVHGNLEQLLHGVRTLGIDFDNGDRLISVGDLVDRGPQSLETLHYFRQKGRYASVGNHELAALEYQSGLRSAERYINSGGHWFVSSPLAIQEEAVALINSMPLAIEVDTPDGLVGIVHANCPYGTWAQLRQELINRDRLDPIVGYLLCDRKRARGEVHMGIVRDVRAVVVGHTPVPVALWNQNVLHIDTGVSKKPGAAMTFCRLRDMHRVEISPPGT